MLHLQEFIAAPSATVLNMKSLILIATASTCVAAFVPNPSTPRVPTQAYGIVDDLQLIFSDEGKKNRAAYDAREIAQQEAAQREILDRRRNPKKMKEYNKQVATNRQKLQDERDIWGFQRKTEKGYDPLSEWKKLRGSGKIQVGSDLERDANSSRLGSEGLVEVRVDERMPYIDQGYVDESADAMGNFMKLFGGGKKK